MFGALQFFAEDRGLELVQYEVEHCAKVNRNGIKKYISIILIRFGNSQGELLRYPLDSYLDLYFVYLFPPHVKVLGLSVQFIVVQYMTESDRLLTRARSQ